MKRLKTNNLCYNVILIKYFLLLFLLSMQHIALTSNLPNNYIKSADDFNYIYNLVSKYSEKYALGYTKRILQYSKQYNLPSRLIARQIEGESRFNPFAKGDWNGKEFESYGSAQIKIEYYKHKLFDLDNGKLGKHIKKRIEQGKPVYYKSYFCRIVYNVELQCIIMRELLNKYNDYPVALLAYGAGQSSKLFKKYRYSDKITNIKFIKHIIGED